MKKLVLLFVLLLLPLGVSFAQGRVATGVVYSSDDNQPIIGAIVRVKDATGGATTNVDGQFKVSLPASAKTLVVSFTGYKTQEVAVGEGLKIVLESDQKQLDDVVVVAYGTAKKSSLTGSASKVKASDLATAKVESVDKALAGKVSGVRVVSATGDPGAAGAVQVRGIGSFSGTTEPLYVVDGVPITVGNYGGGTSQSSNILSTLNPDDVESMTVLKDAAAASLYGSRASNGVVVITTKRGKEGKTQFNLKLGNGWTAMATNPYRVFNAAEARQYYHAAYEGQYLQRNSALLPTDAKYKDATVMAEAKKYADDALKDPNMVPVESDVTRTDWNKEIFGKGYQRELQFSVSGGSQKLRYFASLGYNNVKGVLPFSQYTRYSTLLNVDNQAYSWLNLSFKNQNAYSEQAGQGDLSSSESSLTYKSPMFLVLASLPDKPVRTNGVYTEDATTVAKIGNAMQQLDPKYISLNNYMFRTTNDLSATLAFTDHLKFKSTNSVDFTLVKFKLYYSPLSSDGQASNGVAERKANYLVTKTTSNVLSFNKDFGAHHFDALAGIEAQKFDQQYETFSANKFSTPELTELSTAQALDVSTIKYNSFLFSYLGNVNYSYDNRYYAGVSLRQDRSSKLGRNNQRGLFYSVSGSWRFGQEDFLKNNSVITDGKLRASYGTNGTLPDAEYSWRGLYAFDANYAGESASYLKQIENGDLGWEQSKNFNVGLEITLANRFVFGIEYFNKYTSALLLDRPISSNQGVPTIKSNVGELSNRGWEFEFHGSDILKGTSVRWDADLSLSTLKARVEKLPNGDIVDGVRIHREGQDLYSYYLPTFHGVDPETGVGQFVLDPEKPVTADNLTYNGSLAGKSLVGKSAYPKLYGGLTNKFTFAGVTLSTLLTYQFGGYLFDGAGSFFLQDGSVLGLILGSKDLVGKYWTKPGDQAVYPRPIYSNSLGTRRASTRYLSSSDFIRLKEVSLSYRLPKQWYSRLGIQGVDLSVTANNLFFLYRASKIVDPEVRINGYRTPDIPLLRSFNVGLNVSF